MLDTSEALRLILWALGLGVALPVMVQLYLTLREVRRATATVNSSLHVLREASMQARQPESVGSSVTAIIAAAIPAISAGYRAFRQHQNELDAEAEPRSRVARKSQESP